MMMKQQQQQSTSNIPIRKPTTSTSSTWSLSWLLLTALCLLSFAGGGGKTGGGGVLVQSAIVVTQDEKTCLEETGKLFENNDGLIAARHNYAESMQMDMTTISTMTASYPDSLLDTYKSKCSSNGGQMHVIKIDFFDCTLRKMNREVELTLKNFANCLAAIPECESFDQENLLEEAWEDMGLHCELEDAPSGGSGSNSNSNNNVKPTPVPKPISNDDDAGYDALDDDLANQEKEEEDAAKKGASDEAVPYVPKEEQGGSSSSSSSSSSSNKKKKKSGFWTFLLLASVGGYAFYMHKQGRLRTFRGQLPFGGVTTSRFQERGPFSGGSSGFGLGSETSYNLVGGGNGEEEFNFNPSVDNELQLSSNLM
mmetsp:Transcript_53613/g.130589  ORF Transcript_53613/g.130589 Transcript_53613/m.130589 type:complete len:367 (+) Transcript_53613:273-1373(+)